MQTCNRFDAKINYTSLLLKLQVRLKAKPLREGVLKVIGVRWLLAGIATGHRDFAISGPQISKSKSGARSIPPPNKRLKFHILTVSFCTSQDIMMGILLI